MTKPITGKEPAYPKPDIRAGEMYNNGISIRLHLAAMAPIKELVSMYFDKPCATAEQCAEVALKYADALLAAYNKEQE